MDILLSDKEKKVIDAFVSIFGEEALAEAMKLGAELQKNYVPIGYKDNVVEIKD